MNGLLDYLHGQQDGFHCEEDCKTAWPLRDVIRARKDGDGNCCSQNVDSC